MGGTDRTWTDREHFEILLGRRKPEDTGPSRVSNQELEALESKRARAYDKRPNWQRLDESTAIWKRCDICGNFLCVNNWEDRKSRTPRFKGFIVCGDCDPRHVDDRYEPKHYRVVHRRRLRVIAMAQITRALAKHGCIVPDWHENYGSDDCKCAGCSARKVFP